MLIEELFPRVIGGRKSLKECLMVAARSRSIGTDVAAPLVARAPDRCEMTFAEFEIIQFAKLEDVDL
jgi:hypothetical protein